MLLVIILLLIIMDYTKVLKKINTYYLFLKKNNKISLILKNSNKKEIFIDFKNKYLDKVKKEDYNIVNLILLKIKQVPYNPQQPIKMIFGPIKVEITFFELSKRGAIKVNQFETRNNHLFYTIKYLEQSKISTKDFKKIVQLAIDNKLEKRLLAPKTIEQIE